MKGHSDGYSRAQITFHWTIAVLILAIFFSHEEFLVAQGDLLHGRPLTSGEIALRELHLWGGATVLPLALWRLIIRFRAGVPSPPPCTPPALQVAASITHALLYVLIFLLPLSGMLVYYSVLPRVSGTVHYVGEPALFVLVLTHAMASLLHHFYWKTNVLRRMLKPTTIAAANRR